MFCSKCGNSVTEDSLYCSKCGAAVRGNTPPNSNNSDVRQSAVTPNSYPNLSNKWVWLIAIVPTFILLIVPVLGLYPMHGRNDHMFTPYIFAAIAFAVTCLFLFMDYKELARNGINNVKPWIGILLIPAYLFIRAARSTRKFHYAITWSVLYGFYFVMYLYYVVYLP